MAPIGVAIIGGGIFVKEQHLPAVAKCDLLSLKAIYSRSLKTAKDAASVAAETGCGTPDLYASDAGPDKSFQDLLKRPDIDAVIIALSILSQPEYIEAALAAGKHVLAEKPIAANVKAAKALIESYTSIRQKTKATLAIAENARFMPSFVYAGEQALTLGKVTHFSVRVFGFMDTSTKWYNTEWRKTPEYQGGFLLDGGVHHAASTRLYLGKEASSVPVSVQAASHLEHPHLPPIDSVSAVVRTAGGAAGTYQNSAGTRLRAFEFDAGYERGSIRQVGEKVTVTDADGKETVKEFERTGGVSEEVAAWAKALNEGVPDPRQSPEEALADLEFLEKMFTSGELNGASQTYEHQQV